MGLDPFIPLYGGVRILRVMAICVWHDNTEMSMELSNYLVSWVVTYLGDLQPTYIGVIIYLLSSLDILAPPQIFLFPNAAGTKKFR